MPTTLDKRLGVLTSGGDAPGMNAAVRAVTRMALESRHGSLRHLRRLPRNGRRWDTHTTTELNAVGGILQRGGTIIGTARSDAFRTRAGRLQAAKNLIHNSIDNLVIIGGDGSLTGGVSLSPRVAYPDA